MCDKKALKNNVRKSASFQELNNVFESQDFYQQTLNLQNDDKLHESSDPEMIQLICDQLND